VSGEEEEVDTAVSATTTFSGTETDSTGASTVATLLGFGSLLGATSETVAVTAGSAEVAAAVEVLDVLTILSDYTHISSVLLSSFQYILYIVNYYACFYKIT
jgi:hypothetical protein